MAERIVEHTEHRIDNNPDEITTSKIIDKMKHNPWIVSSIILGIAVLVLLFFVFKGGITGNVVKEDVVAENLIAFANAQGADATLVEVNDKGNFYEVVLSIGGQEAPIYVTKDGKYFTQALIPLTGSVVDNSNTDTNTQTQADVLKSDKPVVELYVFTYCPYGTQSEKGIIPAVNLLGNKIDFKIRQIGAMHGEYEKIEAQRQLCIEKNYPTKFLDYVNDFVSSSEVGGCNGDAACVGPKIDVLYTKLGIDKAKIESCMKTNGATLYSAEEANSKTQGVSGSPTLIINGEKIQSGRDSASYLATICSAFNTAPAECSQTLSSDSPSPGFGSSTTTGTTHGSPQC
ncbi:MAG: hypothetical protein AABW67_05370 [Nanoarchaeota archaeon]